MIRLGVIFFCLLASLCFASNDQREQQLFPIGEPHEVVISYLGPEWVLCLDDDSYWVGCPSQERRARTVKEWWNNAIPEEWALDDSFFSDPRTWKGEFKVQVYEVAEDFVPGYKHKRKHLLENTVTGEKVFAEFTPMGTHLIPKLQVVDKFRRYPVGEEVKILQNSHEIKVIALQDQTLWKIQQMKRGSDQPDAPFTISLGQWNQDDDVQIYFYEEQGSAAHAVYEPTRAPIGLYLLENKTRHQFAYVKPLTLVEFSALYQDYAKEQWREGYRKGYRDGEK